MPRSDSSRREAYSNYYYRRPLGLRELLPALGIAIGAGLFAFYITRLLVQRTPLRIERSPKKSAERTRGPKGAAQPTRSQRA